MELDSCASSDALLMNVFCYPGVSRDGRVSALLGAEPGESPCFGYKARVPLANGKFDRTEVDLRLGNLLVEAKLTESNFQSAQKKALQPYRDFSDVFDRQQLPQMGDHYLSYQLLRNVLAAYALQCSFCVLIDARRPDLADAWYAVMKCVKPIELRTKLRISTWQEVAQAAPARLRAFLAAKYGIKCQTGYDRRLPNGTPYTVAMNDKAQDVECPTCGALPGKPCCRENGNLLSDSHMARRMLASAGIAKAKKKATQPKPLHGD
jgi:hypothetical protein